MYLIRYLLTFITLSCPFYNLNAHTIYVSPNRSNGDGSSWECALSSLQTALNIAQSGDSIWVVQGVFYPTQTADRTISFEISSNVCLFGGFLGNESSILQRQDSARTTLSGNIGEPNTSEDNSQTVVYLLSEGGTTILDGFSIQDGQASGLLSDPRLGSSVNGGGIYIEGLEGQGLVQLNNCTIIDNYADFRGGGILALNIGCEGAAIQLTNTYFHNNYAVFKGGAISFQERGNPLYPSSITSSTFTGNYAESGGAFELSDNTNCGELLIQKCQFIKNEAVIGGAINQTDVYSTGGIRIDACLFERNVAGNLGGAIHHLGRDTTQNTFIDNCIFRYNSALGSNAENVGGAVVFENISSANGQRVFINCLFSNNIFVQNEARVGGAIYLNGIYFFIRNSIFAQNHALDRSGAIGIGSVIEPDIYRISNCIFYKNRVEEGEKRIFVTNKTQSKSKHKFNIRNCIFTDEQNVIYNNLGAFNDFDIEIEHCLFSNITACTQLMDNYQNLHNLNCINNIYAQDPLFRDPTNDDFRLFACSPAVDAGVSLDVLDVDFDGNPRLSGTAVDIGAYEFIQEENIDPISVEFEIFHISENMPKGNIRINEITGGYPPYSYQIRQDSLIFEANALPIGELELLVTDSEQCMASFPFEVSMLSSTAAIDMERAVQLYPNPSVVGELNFIKKPLQLTLQIEIFDETGKLISKDKCSQNACPLSIPNIAGIYFIQVNNGHEILTKRMLRLH